MNLGLRNQCDHQCHLDEDESEILGICGELRLEFLITVIVFHKRQNFRISRSC